MSAPSLVDAAGGEPALRRLLEDFYDRVFADVMIGFLFAGKAKERLVEKELELALEALGVPVPYTGRPIAEVHLPLGIFGGQFLRRRQLLVDTMQDHALPGEVQRAWLVHHDALRPAVTSDPGSDCRSE